jgi:hypothetical protein
LLQAHDNLHWSELLEAKKTIKLGEQFIK